MPALEPESRLLHQDKRLIGMDVCKSNRPWASVEVRAHRPAGRPGTGERSALTVMDLPGQVPEPLEVDGRDRGAFAVEGRPLRDKGREPSCRMDTR